MKIATITTKNKKFRDNKSFSSTCNCGSCNCNCGSGSCRGGFISTEIATQIQKQLSNTIEHN